MGDCFIFCYFYQANNIQHVGQKSSQRLGVKPRDLGPHYFHLDDKISVVHVNFPPRASGTI